MGIVDKHQRIFNSAWLVLVEGFSLLLSSIAQIINYELQDNDDQYKPSNSCSTYHSGGR